MIINNLSEINWRTSAKYFKLAAYWSLLRIRLKSQLFTLKVLKIERSLETQRLQTPPLKLLFRYTKKWNV